MSHGLPRALTRRERQVLVAMIQHANDSDGSSVSVEDRRKWLDRVVSLRVMGACACGECPSVDFSLTDRSASRRVLSAHADGLGLLLFIDDGQASSLEGFPVNGGVFLEFPHPDELVY